MTEKAWTAETVRSFQKERMRAYPSAKTRVNTSTLSKEAAREFLAVSSMNSRVPWDQWVAENGNGPLGEEFPELMVLTKRLTVFDFYDLKITIDALLCGVILGRTIGGSIVFLCDMLHFWATSAPKLIGALEVAAYYPHGFYSESVLSYIADKFMKTGVHPYAFVYGVSAEAAEKVYGKSIHSPEWQWPYPHNENPN